MNDFQLDISLEKSDNRLKDSLDTGKFIVLAESTPPENARSRDEAVQRIMPLAEVMAKQEDLCGGLALTDLYGSPWSAVEIATAMPENLRNSNLYTLSGNGRSQEDINAQLNMAANAGVKNLLHLSGNASGLSIRECRARKFSGSNFRRAASGNQQCDR